MLFEFISVDSVSAFCYSPPMPATHLEEVYRQMSLACLDELHAAKQRIAALEAQLKAARDEIRRIVQAKMGGEE